MLYHISLFHFFLLPNIPLCGYTIFIFLFIHSWIFRFYFHFWLLACWYSYSYSYVQVFVWTYAFTSFGYIPRYGIDGPYNNSIFNFLRNCQAIFHYSCTILHLYQQCVRVPVFPCPHQHLFISFDYSHPSGCEVVPHYGFDFHFPKWWRIALSFFSCTYWPYVYLVREMSVQILCPFFNWVIYLYD